MWWERAVVFWGLALDLLQAILVVCTVLAFGLLRAIVKHKQ